MKFDIYGGNLRDGFCEVHPSFAEPYPCPLCVSEQARKRAALKAVEPKYACHGFHPDDPLAIAFPKVADWLASISDTADAASWASLVHWIRSQSWRAG